PSPESHPDRCGSEHYRSVGGVGPVQTEDEKELIDEVSQKAHSDHLRPVPFVNPHPLTAPSQDDVHRQDGEGEAESIETHRIELPERVLHHGEIETPDHRDNQEQKLNDTNFFIQWMM